MAQIIIDYEEYLKLLEYKKQVEDIQNGLTLVLVGKILAYIKQQNLSLEMKHYLIL